MTKTLSIETPQGRKYVGQIVDDQFQKTVRKSKHLHRALNAWAIDADIIDNLPPMVKGITIREREEDKTYRIDLKTFRDKAVKRDYGFGLQCFLPLCYWRTEDSNQPALFAAK